MKNKKRDSGAKISQHLIPLVWLGMRDTCPKTLFVCHGEGHTHRWWLSYGRPMEVPIEGGTLKTSQPQSAVSRKQKNRHVFQVALGTRFSAGRLGMPHIMSATCFWADAPGTPNPRAGLPHCGPSNHAISSNLRSWPLTKGDKPPEPSMGCILLPRDICIFTITPVAETWACVRAWR